MVMRKSGATMRNKAFILGLGAILMATVAGVRAPADAQGVTDSLDLPTDMTIFEDRDPHVHKPTAIVNGHVITQTDVEQRLALIVLANGSNVPEEELARLRLQVLRNLIDETLQIQEAAANDITVGPATTKWSSVRMSTSDSACLSDCVRSSSARDGSATPDGWLCAKITAAAL